MDFVECFRLLAGRLREEIIVTSAGNCSELWWEITRESERVFYLDASMSLASLFAAGIALGNSRTVVALSGDGAFCMNPGMLMVERQMSLPNLKHFLVSNRCYGSTNELPMPFPGTSTMQRWRAPPASSVFMHLQPWKGSAKRWKKSSACRVTFLRCSM